MANDAINSKLRLYSDVYNDDGYAHVEHLTKGMLHESTLLSPLVTNLYGRIDKRFPLSFLTEGRGKIRSIDSEEFKMPVIGKPLKHAVIASSLYSASDTPGKGQTIFVIPFTTRRFMKNQVLYSKDKDIQVRVVDDPTPDGNVFNYKVRFISSSLEDYCPVTSLAAGVKWAGGPVKVGRAMSRGTEHRSFSPGMVQNQVSTVRASYNIRGNVENKVMNIEIPTDKGIKRYWCEWELYLHNLDWKETCENDLWYSKYNRTANGEISDTDPDSGEPVLQGSGVLEQITNSTTYSYLTTNKLTQIARDAFYGASDAMDGVNIVVFTGTGGMTEAHRAMNTASANYTLVDSVQIKEQGNGDLMFGAYFKKYRHIDGHIISFVKLPMMDTGRHADISDMHPETGLPLESYNMYFLDMSTYEGEANIQYVAEKGREDIQFVVAGATVPKGYDKTVFRASDVDGSSMQWMKSQGIQIKRPTNCFKVFCNIN